MSEQQTDEKGNPITYWGGKEEEPKQETIMKQTPMQELISKLEELRDLHSATGNLTERTSRGKFVFAIIEAKKLLEKEKQVIDEAVEYGFKDAHKTTPNRDLKFDDYYNETFKQK